MKNLLKYLLCLTVLLMLAVITVQAATTPVAMQKLLASDGAFVDWLGRSVSVDGDTALVGASGDDIIGGIDSGSVYVFIRSGMTWIRQAKLTVLDAAYDYFGCSVSLSGDTALIGAYANGDFALIGANSSYSGTAYVFTRSGTTWSQQAKLTASDAASGDQFGRSVFVDGDTVLVGAYKDDDDGESSGSVYVFTRSGAIWTEQQKLTASDAAAGDYFGWSVSLSGDTVLVGAPFEGKWSGSAYVFTRSGATWSQQAKLTASDAVAYDQFGISLSLSGDTVLIGAYKDDDGGESSGSAYVFTRSGAIWTEQQKLTASDAAADDYFGWSVSMDGDTALIGACRDDDDDNGTNSGSVYVFTRSGAIWSRQVKLTASDAAAYDVFGKSVSVDGGTVLIGASGDDDKGEDAGSAYIVTRTDSGWAPFAEKKR